MSDAGRIGECNVCHRAVRYVVTVMGSIIPLDVNPHPDGMVAMVPTPSGARAKIFGGSKGLPDVDTTLWRDHRTHCLRRLERDRDRRQARGPSQSEKRCRGCMLPLDRLLAEAGELFHPCCSGHPHHEAPTYIDPPEPEPVIKGDHRPVRNGYMGQVDCAVCQFPWPCPTWQAINIAGPGKVTGGAPSTSMAAALDIASVSGRQRRAVYDTIREAGPDGMTDAELEHTLQVGGSSIRPRRKELQEAALIVESGAQRPTPSGRMAVVWVTT